MKSSVRLSFSLDLNTSEMEIMKNALIEARQKQEKARQEYLVLEAKFN